MNRLALLVLTLACLATWPSTSQAQFRLQFRRSACGPGFLILQQQQPALAQPVAVAAAAQPQLDAATMALLGRIDGQQGALLQRFQELGDRRREIDPTTMVLLQQVVGSQDRILDALGRGNGDRQLLQELARQQIGAQERLINAIREMPRPMTMPAPCSGGMGGGLLIQQTPGTGGTSVTPVPTQPMAPLPPTTPPPTGSAFRQNYSTHHSSPSK